MPHTHAMEYTLHATTVVDAPPEQVFRHVTDIDRLPAWNTEIARIVESPGTLVVGAQWVLEIRAMGTHWNSRSQVVAIDPARGHFAYRSVSDDGNPSHADWRWDVSEEAAGTRVRVAVDIHPRTFWRRALLSRVRRPSLQKAMERSLRALREEATQQDAR